MIYSLIAQSLMLCFILIALSARNKLWLFENGNIDNPEVRNALDAMWYLERMENRRVS